MLYIFAGFPQNNLNAGGLRYAIEEVEELAILEASPDVQYRKEGVFTPGERGEFLYPIDAFMSAAVVREGIGKDWFKPGWCFGNSVVIHKTTARPEYQTVVHETDFTLDQYLTVNGPATLGNLRLERKLVEHEGWQKYKARWAPSTCPEYNHQVMLTWIATTHRVPPFAWERIRALIEDGAEPKDRHRFLEEHFSPTRIWEGVTRK